MASPWSKGEYCPIEMMKYWIQILLLFCKSLVGFLQYYCITHPELAFSMSRLCHFLASSTDAYLQAWKRVRVLARYLNLWLTNVEIMIIIARRILNIDWAKCPEDRKIVKAYYVFLGDNLISRSLTKQRVVSQSWQSQNSVH